MKIYKLAAQADEFNHLMEEAKKYDSAEEFASAYSVKQNLLGYGVPINEDETVTLYHAASPEQIQKIEEEGVFKGGSTATGGMTGLALEPSSFFGWNKDWVETVWSRSRIVMEIKVPYQYIRQPAKNDQEVYFEGGLKRVDEANNIWEPVMKPRDTFYSRIPATDYDFLNKPSTLKDIWEKANEIVEVQK